MKIHKVEQGSPEWLTLRAGKATASEFDNLVSPTWEIRKGETPAKYVATKAAEIWVGGPLLGLSTWATNQGKILEAEALPWLQMELNRTIERVGFVTGDSDRVGCSPDGLLPDCGIEIKCLQPVHHVSCLLKGELPREFSAQVHGGMYVTGLDRWKLCLYSRQFPSLIFDVARDEKIISVIDEAVTLFLDRLDRAVERLKELNGGIIPDATSNVAAFANLVKASEEAFFGEAA